MFVRPYVVFKPTTPQREEGMRIEPAFLSLNQTHTISVLLKPITN